MGSYMILTDEGHKLRDVKDAVRRVDGRFTFDRHTRDGWLFVGPASADVLWTQETVRAALQAVSA